MAVNKKSGLAIVLIVLGSFIILNKLGLHMDLMGYLVPIAMIGLGYVGVQNGRTKTGWLIGLLGGFILFCKLSGILAVLFAVSMIAFGVSILKKRSGPAGWSERL